MTEHWDGFYGEKLAPEYPSAFCRFILEQELKGETCVELGCGNGRDTFVLAKRYVTVGIDPSASPWKDDSKHPTRFMRLDSGSEAAMKEVSGADIVYSRFWMHTVGQKEAERTLAATRGLFCAETRIKGDRPTLYTDHKRKPIDPDIFIRTAMLMGFELLYFMKGTGLAEYRGEDPLVARFILKRN